MGDLSILNGSLCQTCDKLDYYDGYFCAKNKPCFPVQNRLTKRVKKCKNYKKRVTLPECEYDKECLFWCKECPAWETRNKNISSGKNFDKCRFEMERPVNETLWYAIMKWEPNNHDGSVYGDNPDHTFENDTFAVRAYDWGEENNDWHFWHKPSGFKLSWYKYPLRSPMSNKEITHEPFYAILHDCMNSVHPQFTVKINEWW